jgi:predicted ATPase
MTASPPCSDTVPFAVPRGGLIVLEGMPGAGKTTAACALAGRGLPVLGEYTDNADATIAIAMHPPVEDDDAHQQNWLRKTAQCTARLAHGGTVYADRDWLSSLSYAYSTAAADGGALLRHRAAWAASRLCDGSLFLPGLYVIFDLDPATSLDRRASRLRPGHPWNHPGSLRRLRDFYACPSRALDPVHPGLARALRQPRRADISGLSDPYHILRRLTELGGKS